MAKRTPKRITDPRDLEMILSLNEDTIVSSKVFEMFGEFNGKQKFHQYDEIVVPKGTYGPEGKKNKNDFVTTIGLWLYNRVFIERELFDVLQYVNTTLDADVQDDINRKLSWAFMEDEIDSEKMDHYIMKQQLWMSYVSIVTPNHTEAMLVSTRKIEAKKKELLKKYSKAIEEKDAPKINEMEKELLDYSLSILEDDPSMDTYNSKARASKGNNFKNMYVMKGLSKSPDPSEGYNLITSAYMEGVNKEDYVKLSNALIEGPYKRAKKTEVGGSWEKLFLAAFQHIVIGPEGSDCGTSKYVEVNLTKKNINDWMYNYIKDGSKLVELTSKTMDKYIGKRVKFRFASKCEAKGHICHKCAGNMWYRLGVTNIGTATPQLAAIIKLKSMKAFHDSTVKYVEIDPMKVFSLK